MTILYLIDYWVPASEHKGLVVTMASSDEECLNLLQSSDDFDNQYKDLIIEKIKGARKFPLAFDFPAEIVEKFIA